MIKKYFMVVAICLSFIISQQGLAADFTIQINPSPNSVGDQEVSEISASKISGFASLVFSTISSTLSNYLLKSEIKAPTMQEFKTAGSFVYYLPQNPRPLYIKVKVIGGGGSGQGSGTTNPPAGSAGNLSSFGSSLLIATGGGAATGNGNLGGHCTINSPAYGSCFVGGLGQGIIQTPFSGSQYNGGQGGSSCVGGNGSGGFSGGSGNAGVENSGGGGGGAGSPATGQPGGGGGAGGCLVATIPNPDNSYNIIVGAQSLPGNPGSGGLSGGRGGSGRVIVEEFYQ